MSRTVLLVSLHLATRRDCGNEYAFRCGQSMNPVFDGEEGPLMLFLRVKLQILRKPTWTFCSYFHAMECSQFHRQVELMIEPTWKWAEKRGRHPQRHLADFCRVDDMVTTDLHYLNSIWLIYISDCLSCWSVPLGPSVWMPTLVCGPELSGYVMQRRNYQQFRKRDY